MITQKQKLYLETIAQQARIDIEQTEAIDKLKLVHIKYLGRKGIINTQMQNIPELPLIERKDYGIALNDLKKGITRAIEKRKKQLSNLAIQQFNNETIDVTIPGIRPPVGHKNPLTMVVDDVLDIFTEMNYEILEGPDVETEHYNFEVLNIPKHHPARDLQDTFWLKNGLVPRTHTSSMQVRTMEQKEPPFKVAVPGWVYRQEREDVTHSAYFHQVEAFAVGENISFSNLKGTLFTILRRVLGEDTDLKFRASYFPYVEPCAEVSATCPHCKGNGCSICSDSGWIEILGSGMIHPTVLKNSNIDPNKYSGFAFAFGTTRIAMLKYKINDIRLITNGDLRFNNQF